MKEHPAHIRKDGEEFVVQTVKQHCEAAGRYAADCLAPASLSKTGYLAGLLHDCGKCKDESAEYQWGAARGEHVRRGSVNHTFAAVRYLLESYHGDTPARYDDVACEILACAVGGHHGLFDCVDQNGADGFEKRLEKENISYEESLKNFFSEVSDEKYIHSLYDMAVSELSAIFEKLEKISGDAEGRNFTAEMSLFSGFLSRLLLSAVIEGDRRDTDEFMNGSVYPHYSCMSEIWEQALRNVEQKLGELPCKTEISRTRASISQKCRSAAQRPGGIYRLNLPTGAGKTLSSLRYALSHAHKYGKSRIVFVLPLLAIIEQNADIIREYVGDDRLVLEHHSNVVSESYGDDELDGRELMCENWSAPIVITTLAQALNTMFSGKTTAIRRFQALCASVIVFDEIQSVPTKMLSQFNAMLTFLSEICGATIILCSATQPELKAAKRPVRAEINDLVALDAGEQDIFVRTRLVDVGAMRLDEVPCFAADIMKKTDSLLIVCNKKSEAQELYNAMRSSFKAFHLSASMCTAHRRQTLSRINALLGREKLVCISTQVIEAGVDVSFGCVIRFTAGMDSVVQAAGRCNRNGESLVPVPVYLLTVADENLKRLRDIKTGRDVTLSILDEFEREPDRFDGSLTSEQAISRYYRDYYTATRFQQDYEVERPVRDSLYSLLSENIILSDRSTSAHKRFYMHQAFRLAGSLFEVYDNNTTQVVVPFEEGEEIIKSLCSEKAKRDFAFAKELVSRAKDYSVSLYSYQLKKLEDQTAIYAAGETGVIALKPGYYDNEAGLKIDAEKLDYLEV